MNRLKSKFFPILIGLLSLILSCFIISVITTSWINRAILFVLALDLLVACNVSYTYGLKRLMKKSIVRKKYMITLLIIELGCIWMCIYKYLTIDNNQIYLIFQYLIYLMIMSVIFWFFTFTFIIEIKYWKLYPMLALTFGIVFMLAIPIYVVPDEPVHLMTAYKVSNRILNTDRTKGYYIYGRADDMEMPITTTEYNLEKYTNYLARLNTPLQKGQSAYKLSGTNYLHTPQYQYYISGLGITIGRLLNFGTIKTFLLGRLFNLVLFVSVLTLAIYKTPKGKLIMMVLALTPIVIQQGMSYSYDVIVISLSFLIAALSLKLYSEDFHKLDYLILLIATMLLIPTKQFAYAPYALIPWLYLLIKRFSFKSLLASVGAITLIALICYALINQNLFPFPVKSMLTNRKFIDWAQDYSYSILSLIKDPVLSLKIAATTIYSRTDFYFSSIIGKDLGWFEISLPIIYPAFISLITLAVLFDKDQKKYSSSFWLNAVLLSVLSILFTFAGMLFGWTPKSSLSILGVQGRYIIVVLPLILMFISDKIDLKVNGKLLKEKLIILLLILLTISSDGIMVFMNR